MDDKVPTACDVVNQSVQVRAAIVAVLFIDGSYGITFCNIGLLEGLGLAEAIKNEIILQAKKDGFFDADGEDQG